MAAVFEAANAHVGSMLTAFLVSLSMGSSITSARPIHFNDLCLAGLYLDFQGLM